MPELIPGLVDQLNRDARRLAVTQISRRRRRVRAAGVTAASSLVATTGAYAARGIWLPQLGREDAQVSASASAPPDSELEAFSVLRREQSDQDRSIASRVALKSLDPDYEGVRTAFVRDLGTSTDGTEAVLVPVLKKVDDQKDSSPDALCLWITDSVDGGGLSCASSDQAAEQGLVLAVGARPASEVTNDASSHVLRLAPQPDSAPGTVTIVGLVPDGVDRVVVGDGAVRQTLPVDGNVYTGEVAGGRLGAPSVKWLASDGKVISGG